MTKTTNPFKSPTRLMTLIFLPALVALFTGVLAMTNPDISNSTGVGSNGRVVVIVGGAR